MRVPESTTDFQVFTSLNVSARFYSKMCKPSFKKKMAYVTETTIWEIPNSDIYLASADNVSFGGQKVDNFPFSFVPPLRTENHCHLVPRVVAHSLLSTRWRLVLGFLLLGRPVERHNDACFSLSVSRRLSCLQERHCHICNFRRGDVRSRRTEIRSSPSGFHLCSKALTQREAWGNIHTFTSMTGKDAYAVG